MFEHKSFSIVLDIDSNNDRTSIGGTITELTLTPVPEPSKILLMGIGLLGLVGIRGRKKS
ncbi:MAG: PEP-CTERM sorting domain-containing protein [Deltaproteobacteria bacterium]|nr:PEP-CTERM sorting domain-containing protein [Deltaproteobacteria bacterium]